MSRSKMINWPNQTTLTARSSTITSAFVHTITPWITSLSPEEEANVRAIYSEIERKYNIKILGTDKSENRCAYCGREAASADHINALVSDKISSGAITEIYNLLPCCNSCNSSKGRKTFEEWFDLPKTQARMRKILNEPLSVRRAAVVELIDKLNVNSSQSKVLKLHAQPKFAKRLAEIYAMRDDINKRLADYEENCKNFAADIQAELE